MSSTILVKRVHVQDPLRNRDAICDTMTEQPPQARRPSAGMMPGR
jgi:hypothetical protein